MIGPKTEIFGCGRYTKARIAIDMTVSKAPRYHIKFHGYLGVHLRQCPQCKRAAETFKQDYRLWLTSHTRGSLREIVNKAAQETRSKFALVARND